MPRNKILIKGRGAPSKNGNKIVIRPYQKPPTLPPNYYETTVQDLLRVTMAVLDTTLTASAGQSNNEGTRTKTSSGMSLQNAYTAVVNLVSHQFGPRLYQDLKQSMQQACEKVLTSSQDWSTNGDKIPALYQSYTEYLLCVKHVFLPLDRTHVWRQQQQTGNASSSSNPAMTTSDTGAPTQQQSLWQVGLTVWAERLTSLGLDKALYQSWLELLLQEWNPSGTTPIANIAMSGSGSENILRMTISSTANTASWLQSVWYMWQDLGWSGALMVAGGSSTGAGGSGPANPLDIMTQLQQDLEGYWKSESQKWAGEIPYRIVPFVHFCHEKHSFILQKWPWLPSVWLQSLVEHFLFLPHLVQMPQRSDDDDVEMANNNTMTVASSKKNTPPGLLLQPANFNPLLEEAILSQNLSMDRSNAAISQLWMLAGRIPQGQVAVAQAVAQFARTQGLLRVSGGATAGAAGAAPSTKKASEASALAAVGDLLQLQDSLRQLIRSLPHGAELIKLKSVWEEVVNQDTKPMSVGEALAKFLDQTLRSNKKMDEFQQQHEQLLASTNTAPAGSNVASSNHWLHRIISGIFVPLQAKDVFEAFYKRDLAKRLLLGRVQSMDVEKQVCSLLKAECGAAYTSKMEGMFQDVDWSRETMMVYKNAIGNGANNNGVEMEVQVLTTGYWPVYPQYPGLQLPASLKEHQDKFDNHYKTKYQGRRMTWQYSLGQCTVRVSGLRKPYDLLVGLTQALVLLQLNDSSQKWTLPMLQKAVGLEDRGEMERILQSLSAGKEGTRILRKMDHDRDIKPPPGEPQQSPRKKKPRSTVHDEDAFVVNESFESNQRRIRIPNLMMKETKDERDKTVEGVARDRLYLIDAVLVRVMKARKTIMHQALIPQVLEQVKVPAQPADVKKRIESLIEREYMERDAKDRNRYNYLA